MAAEDYAIVVGIASYPGLVAPALQGPEHDAEAFREWLILPQGGDVPDVEGVHIHTIRSAKYTPSKNAPDARPWKADIYAAFDRLRERGKQNGGRTGRRLYMFFAGHGISPENDVEEAALLMANAAKGNLAHVPGRKLAKHFSAAAYFDQVVLFMDCCRDSWGNTRLQSPDWDAEQGTHPADSFMGFAAQWDQKARERQYELKKGEPKVHGAFTAHLITMLRSGRMSASLLRSLMLNSAKRFAVPNTVYDPKLEPELQDKIIFNETAEPVTFPVRIQTNGIAQNELLYVCDGRFKEVYRDRPANGEITLPLPPTNYQAQILPAATRKVAFDVPGQDSIAL